LTGKEYDKMDEILQNDNLEELQELVGFSGNITELAVQYKAYRCLEWLVTKPDIEMSKYASLRGAENNDTQVLLWGIFRNPKDLEVAYRFDSAEFFSERIKDATPDMIRKFLKLYISDSLHSFKRVDYLKIITDYSLIPVKYLLDRPDLLGSRKIGSKLLNRLILESRLLPLQQSIFCEKCFLLGGITDTYINVVRHYSKIVKFSGKFYRKIGKGGRYVIVMAEKRGLAKL
jgi:hypothetical protein